jgi:hypothetical protein
MLVYATKLRFASNVSAEFLQELIACWISRKTRSRVAGSELGSQGAKRFEDASASRVEVDVADGATEFLSSIRLSHADSSVSGRQWVVELGFRGASSEAVAEFSAVVQTNEISTLVATPVTLSPPRIVSDILSSVDLVDSTPGLRVLPMSTTNARDVFLYELLSTDRAYPVVIVGSSADHGSTVDVELLRALVCGLAEVRSIAPHDDTFAIGRSMTGIPAPHSGAVVIVFPRSRVNAGAMPYWQLLKTSELRGMDIGSSELAILARVLHRTNLPTSWKHISPASVAEARRHEEYRTLRASMANGSVEANELAALVDKAESESKDLRAKAETLERERDDYWFKAEGLLESLDEKEKAITQLNVSFRELQKQFSQSSQPSLGNGTRDLICQYLSDGPTVLSGLRLVRELYPDRLLVLASAERSAGEHWAFEHCSEAFSLMTILATTYWEALAAGKGDAEARKAFPDRNFAAKEAATLSKTSRRARTFRIDDEEEMFMEPHLKIQRGPNEAGSWRLHFEWLATSRRICIGHCGVHLPL